MTKFKYRLEVSVPGGKTIVSDNRGNQWLERDSTFFSDGLRTWHDSDFLSDVNFVKAYSLACAENQNFAKPESFNIQWRAYIYSSFIKHALTLPGNCIEFGVARGFMARLVSEMYPSEIAKKTFYLVDTYDGIPSGQASEDELKLAESKNKRFYRGTNYDYVQDIFRKFQHVKLIKGMVPNVLTDLEDGSYSFCSIDMNITKPEIDAFNYIWPRMVKGGVVLLDDYNSSLHREQKLAFNKIALEEGFTIIALPTGQGFILKV